MKLKKSVKRTLALLLVMICFASPALSMKAEAAGAIDYYKYFDAKYYYNNNPDLQVAIGYNPDLLWAHYVTCGFKEGRAAWNPANGVPTPNGTLPTTATAATPNTYGTMGTLPTTAVAVPGAPGALTYLSSYTTSYADGIPRAANIALAASRINGKTIAPGQGFSFSNTILPRTAANGYQVAPVYVNKKVSSGIGGGICQVSTTLYCALRFGNVTVTERHPHSLPVAYVPAGYDATISGTALDLKFVNNYSQPIYIAASAVGGNLTVTLYLVG